jgi:hypothetical protein
MADRGMVRKVSRLEVLAGRLRQEAPALERLRADPVGTLAAAGLDPDPWQIDVLTSTADRMLLSASRQSGKRTVSAALALLVALLQPDSLLLLLCKSGRQSGVPFRKLEGLFHRLARTVAVVAESAMRMELANDVRVVSLPGNVAISGLVITNRSSRCLVYLARISVSSKSYRFRSTRSPSTKRWLRGNRPV